LVRTAGTSSVNVSVRNKRFAPETDWFELGGTTGSIRDKTTLLLQQIGDDPAETHQQKVNLAELKVELWRQQTPHLKEQIVEMLLGETPVEEFVALQYGKLPLHTRSGMPPDNPIFSTADIEGMLQVMADSLNCTSISELAAKGGVQLVSGGLPATVHNMTDMHDMFMNRGHSIVLNLAHRYHTQIRQLAMAVQHVFGRPVQANIYISPPDAAPAFQAHSDLHDVLVLHLEGHKTWDVWDPWVTHAGEEHRRQFVELREAGLNESSFKNHRRVTMRQNDVLYLPQGFLHKAAIPTGKQEDSPDLKMVSVHVTMSLTSQTDSFGPSGGFTFGDLLKNAVDMWFQLPQATGFREPVPPSFDHTRDDHRAQLRSLLEVIEKDTDFTAMFRHLTDKKMQQVQKGSDARDRDLRCVPSFAELRAFGNASKHCSKWQASYTKLPWQLI